MSHSAPVSLGVVGLGGYAGHVRRMVLEQGQGPHPALRLAAVCDPALEAHAAVVESLKGQGVKVFGSIEALLQTQVQAVWLPVPIDLHRPFAELALAAGKAVMCEKPAAGVVQDVDAMIAARDRAKKPCFIGFQDIYDPQLLVLKQHLLNGDLGAVQRASVLACWPRNDSYYGRATWAGALKRSGTWVLDSPVNNAMSHNLNAALFLLGSSLYESAAPQRVEAELYRARPIENYDTASLGVQLPSGATLLVLMTHACAQSVDPVIEIVAQHGRARVEGGHIELVIGGRQQALKRDHRRFDMLERFAAEVRGEADERAAATLEVARAHSLVISGASQACPVRSIPDSFIQRVAHGDGGQVHAVPGIEAVFQSCAQAGRMLHESGQVTWSQPARACDLRNYSHFSGPAQG